MLPFPHGPIVHPGRVQMGGQISLASRAAAQLRFREIRPSEAFTLQDETGAFFRAKLLSISERGAEALVYEAMARSPEPPIRLCLYCAVLARQRMIFVAQKATELGIAHLFPLFTEHSVGPAGLEHEKAHSWPGQALRASRQCRRASVPVVHPAAPLAEALSGEPWQSAGRRLYLDDQPRRSATGIDPTDPSDPSSGSAPNAQRPTPGTLWVAQRPTLLIALAVGPEGGWSEEERGLLEGAGAERLVLGGRVLRAETAVLVGLTLVQHWYGDLRPDR